MIKHYHADLIHAWADGAAIQYKDIDGFWIDVENPTWSPMASYRIKPAKKIYYVVGSKEENKLLFGLNTKDYEYVHVQHCYQLQGIENPHIIWCDDWWKHVDSPFDFLTTVMARTR